MQPRAMPVKRILPLLVITALLTGCVGNVSLWGQYQTPTPVGGSVSLYTTTTPASQVVFVEQTPTALSPQATSTPTSLIEAFVTLPASSTPEPPTPTFAADTILYYAQSGDWLPAVANRFGVSPSEITSPKTLPQDGYIDQGTLLIIPDRRDPLTEYTPALQFIPDSEFVFSATALDFEIETYIQAANGYLATYREYLGTTGWTTSAQGIQRLATENSVNPRLLLAVLDYESQWVRGKPANEFRAKYPLGYENYLNTGMFGQLTWAINQMSQGYYGWRNGTLTEVTFTDGKTLRLDPTLNAGTVAVMILFSKLHTWNEWLRIMDATSGFPAFYQGMFGDPWTRASSITSFFPPSFSQPPMSLPFETNVTWAFTGGPHSAWGANGPLAALDFAPRNDKSGCYVSPAWVTAVAPGLVVRSGNGVVVIDFDGDGREQTGWNIMYLHIASKGRVEVGTWVNLYDKIGHASCEGGVSTGTHTHIARKYNGEWMLADGPIPFNLSGWTAEAGTKAYLGRLVRTGQVVTADVNGAAVSLITRTDGE